MAGAGVGVGAVGTLGAPGDPGDPQEADQSAAAKASATPDLIGRTKPSSPLRGGRKAYRVLGYDGNELDRF